MGWTASAAESIGAPEAGLRLILGQVAAYPLFLLYRSHLCKSDEWVQHAYFAATGLFMSWWSVGSDALFHSTLCVLITFAALKVLGANRTSAVGLFAFNLLYLFAGYVLDSSNEYDITWTMPQCVICLRLIGLAFDLWDGAEVPREKWSKDQQANALTEFPSLLECFGHSFFLGGYFVGPQFSMKKLKAMIERNRSSDSSSIGSDDSPVPYGFGRFALGWAYMLFHLIGSGYIPESWVTTEDYAATPFLKRSFYFYVWVKVILAKYIAAWLLAEGACVIAGLGYNGKGEDGKTKWNGAANVNVIKFETCQKFQHLIESFNVNTNGWVLSYVYKRLRFLNNKNLSQLGTLVFLAVWHGYHSGYYVTFFNEFFIMMIEREFVEVISRLSAVQSLWSNPLGSFACAVFGHLYYCLMLPHCFLAFAMLKSSKYIAVMSASGWFLQFYFVVGVIAINVLKTLVKKPRKPEDKAKAQ